MKPKYRSTSSEDKFIIVTKYQSGVRPASTKTSRHNSVEETFDVMEAIKADGFATSIEVFHSLTTWCKQ